MASRPVRGINGKPLVGADGRPIMAAATSYEGAGTGRRAGNWHAPASGPNTALNANLPNLRNRSRAEYRNNPWVSKGINSLVTNEIGTGITPRSTCRDKAFREAIDALWDLWAPYADPEGNLDIYGIQAQTARARNTSGEVFVRRRPRRLSAGLPVPLQLQVLESDHVPAEKTESLPSGNEVVAGVEFGWRGQRTGYHMWAVHPGEYGRNAGQLRWVPAADIIHHYLPLRPGQVRGEPVTAAALLKARTFDVYDDAELTRKQTRAPFTAALYREQFEEGDYAYDPITGEALGTDDDGVKTLDAQPGQILSLLPGEKLQLFDGDVTGSGYAEFMRQQLMAISAGHGVPYELLTGDWSKVNDRLVRAILNEFRRAVEMAQDHLTIHQLCRRTWEWFVDAAVLAGAVDAPGYATLRAAYLTCEWRPHGWQYVNPLQDVQAKKMAIHEGLTSRDAEVAATGWDADEVDRQNVAGEKRLRELRQAAGLPVDQGEDPI